MNSRKHLAICIALLLTLALSLTACGAKTDPAEDLPDETEADTFSAPEPEEEPVDEEAAAIAAAMEQYRAIANQAASYEYSGMEPTGVYRYALVPMQTAHNIPALFLEQETTFGIGYIRVFQYDPDSETVRQPEDTLMEGVGEVGGYRGSLTMAGDGNGVLVSELSSGTGEGYTNRVTVDGDTLLTVTLWEGNFFDESNPDRTFEEIGSEEIVWYNTADTSALDNWTPDGSAPASDGDSVPPPTDGNRVVFRGTAGLYSYDEVVSMQGRPDPNAEWSDHSLTYRLIVLDEPQTMTLVSGDGDGHFDGTVSFIRVPYGALGKAYDGQALTFSIDPDKTWWPSDTSLPLGQPYTMDVHVLE